LRLLCRRVLRPGGLVVLTDSLQLPAPALNKGSMVCTSHRCCLFCCHGVVLMLQGAASWWPGCVDRQCAAGGQACMGQDTWQLWQPQRATLQVRSG
jgi:hypothetical protein